ncbi:helix-turn-helix transcriptional regulator [Ectobacillus sp. JY-23]|uniref:helix-turn-helix domain-containing protein n=1 Tax=Ectobacillus sp. JY-23 TaxID=2933872 RepID=UPI001FF211B6|nr:helix-turn-helix domain-containing protein [Ectobacillus sp. JY-23]UOY94534.1 helix-turn-helix transcriptional regulator [Ectobacillus sp. JY-23]
MEQIGLIIKDVRKALGYTQKELVEGICSQAQLSKIESGKENPSSVTLYKIAKKLGIDINYFFNVAQSPQLEYMKNIKAEMRKQVRNRNYGEVAALIKREKDKQIFQDIDSQQFFLWHEGVCVYYLERNEEKAISFLKTALRMTSRTPHFATEREIEILNSIGIIYNETKKYEESIETYTKALQLIHTEHEESYKVKIRVLYGLSKSLTAIQKFTESVDYIDLGIKECLKQETLYLFGELHYQQGVNWHHLNEKERAVQFMQKAATIFELQQNYTFSEFVHNNISML